MDSKHDNKAHFKFISSKLKLFPWFNKLFSLFIIFINSFSNISKKLLISFLFFINIVLINA